MRPPNLLERKWGRLTTFFFFYLTEGIPLGFVATAVATQLRRDGVGPAEIGAFVGSFYLPWSFKWIMGPFVDVFSSDRLGRRRMWIVGAQSLMVITLLSTVGLQLPMQLKLFTMILLVHNIFAATQDVAIDALAVNVLEEKERGLANGVMFAAAYLGQTVGGSGVLFLSDYLGFKGGVVLVASSIAFVTLAFALPMREPKGEPRPDIEGSPLAHFSKQIAQFVVDTVKAFFGTRGAFFGLIFALLPAGAMSLGLALQTNLAVELGLNDNAIARLNLWSAVLSAFGCILGGFLSDKLGRRRSLAVYIATISLPVFWLAMKLKEHEWIMPVDVTDPNRILAPAALVTAFWIATLTYSVFNGLMYGTRTALFMDVTVPKVAATQFTAYMALLNLTISYSATWQGWWIEKFGYPSALTVDGVFGLVCILVLPFMVGKKLIKGIEPPD